MEFGRTCRDLRYTLGQGNVVGHLENAYGPQKRDGDTIPRQC